MKVRSPLRDLIERAERSRWEQTASALASVGLIFLVLASLLPAAYAAIKL